MPISTTCQACKARLTVPDAALGKRVKCRNCQAIFEVTAPPKEDGDSDFEVVESPPAPPPSKPAKPTAPAPAPVVKAILDDDEEEVPTPKRKTKRKDEDDESDEDEEPKVQSKRKKADDEDSDDDEPKKKKSNLVKILVILGAAVFLVGGCVVGGVVIAIYQAGKAFKDAETNSSGFTANPSTKDGVPTPAVTNWVPFESLETQYTAAFPDAKPAKLDPFADEPDPEKRKLAESFMKDMKSDSYGVSTEGRRYLIGAVIYPPKTAAQMNPKATIDRIDLVAQSGFPGSTSDQPKWILVNGHIGKDFVLTHNNRTVLMRYIATKDGGVYALRVEGDPAMKPDDEKAKVFFEKFLPKAAKGPYTENDLGSGKKPKK